MGHRVDTRRPAPAGGRIADVADLERQEPGLTGERLEVGLVALGQVVDREDRVAPLEELADDPPTDEPGGTRHEDPHG